MSKKSPLILWFSFCPTFPKVGERNCGIFRCGIYKSNFLQIPQHLDKEACLDLVLNKTIYGCGRPFRLVGNSAEICDYI